MSKPNRGDISIGKDRWITFVDIDFKRTDAVDLDAIIEPIWPFLSLLETRCLHECCGIDAFDFWPENVARTATEFAKTDLQAQMFAVRHAITKSPGEVFVSHRMNQYLHRCVLLELLDHLAASCGDGWH